MRSKKITQFLLTYCPTTISAEPATLVISRKVGLEKRLQLNNLVPSCFEPAIETPVDLFRSTSFLL